MAKISKKGELKSSNISSHANIKLKYPDELGELAVNIIDTIREPLLILDENLIVVKASRSFYNFFKVTPDETIGTLIYDLGNRQWDISTLRELLETILPEKTFFDNYKVEHNFSTIGKRIMLLNARQIERALGKEKVILLAIEDISLQNSAEEKLQKTVNNLERSNKELEQFAYVASHDLQEPLRMVSSFTQLLERRYKDKLDNDAVDFIHYAVDGANRMQLLINDLLEYSRISTKGKELKHTDINSALGKAIVNLHLNIESASAMVLNDELPVINADEGQIMRLFQNLIGNAIKFKGEEAPRIHVKCKELVNAWQFSIQDNGIGIADEFKERIFIIFQRLHTRKEYPGTGIGLAICKRIVERHGGKIWFESEPDKGTIFYFTIAKRSIENE